MTLNTFPPTANHQTGYGNGRAFDSKSYKDFKKDVDTELWNHFNHHPLSHGVLDVPAFSLEIYYHWTRWFNKKGQLRKKLDVSNRYKSIEDAIFRFIEVDDAYNLTGIHHKVLPWDARDQYMTVRLYGFRDWEYQAIIHGKSVT